MKTKLTNQQIFDLLFKYNIQATPNIMNKKNWWNHKEYWSWIIDNKTEHFPDDFVDEFKDVLLEVADSWNNWPYISHKRLSVHTIRVFKEYVDWNVISSSSILSENFIREFKDRVNWIYISRWQNLSDEFIEEFKDRINFNALEINPYYTIRTLIKTNKKEELELC